MLPPSEASPWPPAPVALLAAGLLVGLSSTGAAATVTASDPLEARQWGLARIGLADALEAAGAPRHDVVVAVLDSGVDPSHPDLPNVLAGIDLVDHDDDASDDCGHGTHVAGTVAAARGNGEGVSGVAPAAILPIRVIGKTDKGCEGGLSTLAAAIRHAVREGADVITMSLGCPPPCYDADVAAAVDEAWAAGVLVVASAGDRNGGALWFPGSLPNVLSVGALGRDGAPMAPAGPGAPPDLLAPGESILSTAPGGGYARSTGPSMAVPHVAGAAALLLSMAPLSNEALRRVLTDSARPVEGHGGALDLLAAVRATAAPAP